MDHQDVRAAVAEMRAVLGPRVGADWSVAAGPLEWSCRETAVHVAHDLLAYAGQLAGQPDDGYLPFDLTVRPEAGPAEVLRVVDACGGLLVAALAASGPEVRAWHWGPSDPEGFAAMGVAEVLLHTHDITTGLGVAWSPSDALCAAVLRRLFPDAPDGDPLPVLLWSTGRGELPGRARRSEWVWKAAVE